MAKPQSRRKARTIPVTHLPEVGASWWDRLSGTAQHAICLLLLLAISVGFFAPIHFSGKSLMAGDTVSWRAMAQDMIQYRDSTGEEALWAPNAFAGMPGFMVNYPNIVPQADDVANALRPLIWPTSHFLVLLLGSYLLLFFLTGNRLAGVLAAIGFGLTTYIPLILATGHNSKFIALCYAPWMLLAFAYALRKPGILAALFFAAATALNLRAGHVQITYYLSFLIGIWWIVEAVVALRGKTLKAFGASTAWLALGAVLALGMVAQPYLANAEYKNYTVRGTASGGEPGGLDWEYAMNWSQGIGELITLVIADAYGGSGQLYWGPKPFTSGPHYVGGIVVLLALIGLWKYRRGTAVGLGVAALFMTLFSFGNHFGLLNEPMFRYFPLFDAFRAPETWLSVVALALATLAGLGLYVAVSDAKPATTRAITLASVAFGGFMLILMLMNTVFLDFSKPDEAELVTQAAVQQQQGLRADDPQLQAQVTQYLAQMKTERKDLFRNDALRTLLMIGIGGGLILLYRRGRVPAWALQGTLVALVLFDLGGVGRRYLNEEVLVDATALESRIPRYDFDDYLLQHGAGERGRFRVLSLESDPFTNARPSYYYESMGGYSAAKLRLFQDYQDHLFVKQSVGMPDRNALDMMNVRYVVAGGTIPGLNPVFQGQNTQMLVLENPDVLPRAWFVEDVEVIAQPSRVWERLQDDTFDVHRRAVVTEPLGLAPAPIDSTRPPVARLDRYTPREIVLKVETDRPRLLVLSEVYYPAGWRADIDGAATPILRTNYLLRGVTVPTGAHTLTMRFEPRSHTLGVTIATVFTIVVYGGLLLMVVLPLWKRRRTASGPADTPGGAH